MLFISNITFNHIYGTGLHRNCVTETTFESQIPNLMAFSLDGKNHCHVFIAKMKKNTIGLFMKK